MRKWGGAILLVVAACQQQAKPAQITFDGAPVTDVAAIRSHGERLTHVLGCTGCHGVHLEGTFLTKDEPQYGPLYASNLSVEVPEYTDAQLDAIIRRGVHPERKAVWGMPSQIFQHLSDPDMRALTVSLRTLKPIGTKLPPPQFSKADKEDIASGVYKPADKMVQETKGLTPLDPGAQYALGRYITEVTCAECHGPSSKATPTRRWAGCRTLSLPAAIPATNSTS